MNSGCFLDVTNKIRRPQVEKKKGGEEEEKKITCFCHGWPTIKYQVIPSSALAAPTPLESCLQLSHFFN